ncbi:hypothetical protein [Amycolatopsis sp.]|uniref:hypothetical protein n=1 Tax=Amycolatopsis sp. TaxID=37632 RepID=UPI002D1E198B|nr:hypothetical protein [Amycolatopsis sp.]HVV11599.1 hypothetical protein [Amycolatopsis sp.]
MAVGGSIRLDEVRGFNVVTTPDGFTTVTVRDGGEGRLTAELVLPTELAAHLARAITMSQSEPGERVTLKHMRQWRV